MTAFLLILSAKENQAAKTSLFAACSLFLSAARSRYRRPAEAAGSLTVM